jgi:hypothetical protein
MATLRDHLAARLSDPGFRADYGNWCEACARTMEIIGHIYAAGTPVEDLARQVGLESERIASFIDAERCEYEVMVKLCAHFGLTPPEGCPRKA